MMKLNRRQRLAHNLFDKPTKHFFVHIPKNAGVSMLALLNGKQEPAVHDPVSVYKRHLGKSFDDYFSFAFVRNPWDRMVSLYLYRVNHECHFRNYETRFPTFDSFVNYAYKVYKNNKNHDPVRTQLSYISERNKIIVKYVGRFETLRQDINTIFSKIKRNVPKELPHIHKMDRKHYTEYYNEQTKNIISEIFYDDIKTFKYTYEEKE